MLQVLFSMLYNILPCEYFTVFYAISYCIIDAKLNFDFILVFCCLVFLAYATTYHAAVNNLVQVSYYGLL